MDLFAAISSLNKVGIIFFIITLAALGYEVFAFKKAKKTKKVVPKIPDFDPSKKADAPTPATPLILEETPLTAPVRKKPSVLPIIITAVILLAIGGFTLLGFIRGNSQESSQSESQVQVQPPRIVTSNGIKVFDANWQELSTVDLKNLPSQTPIFIGIETIQGADITQARIRVNEAEWNDAHVTTTLNPDENVYFIEYIMPEGVTSLKIEGQLYSSSSGWPQ